MIPRRLGSTDLVVSPIGFGAFKIGRNEGIKYERGYELPTLAEAVDLVRGAVNLGITLIDTAPAYGSSEERVGAAIADRRERVLLSTKVGERMVEGRSRYDFSPDAIRASVEESLRRLGTRCLDLLFVHSNGQDVEILADGTVTATLRALRDRGIARAIGFSGKTNEGHRLAIAQRYDALMVEYHPLDTSQRPTLELAAERGVGVVLKKAMASGRVPPDEAIPFALAAPAVASAVIGSLRLENLRQCVGYAGD